MQDNLYTISKEELNKFTKEELIDKVIFPLIKRLIDHLLGEDFKTEFHKFIPALLFANTHSEIHPQAP
ncbi:MAG: hypothetical protein KKH92_09690 [Firmicutes bacterium]|nr:hypothetical protein [Bacillota bacterium]